jgi:hypothetical protein
MSVIESAIETAIMFETIGSLSDVEVFDLTDSDDANVRRIANEIAHARASARAKRIEAIASQTEESWIMEALNL